MMHDDDDDGSDGNKMDFKTIFPNNGRRQKQREQTPQRNERQKQTDPSILTARPKKPKTTPRYQSTGKGIKTKVKLMVLNDPRITTDEIVERLGIDSQAISKILVSNIRMEFRSTLKLLKEQRVNVMKLEL
jgi:hypothetical protein